MNLVIDCEALFDGHKIFSEGARVKVKNGKIVAIKPKGQTIEEAESRLACKFLMPGLIDMHLHITGYEERMPAGAPFRPMIRFMKLLLCHGVTTVRDVGNSLEVVFYLQKWSRKHPGPRIFYSGPLLDKPPAIWLHTRVVTTAKEVQTEVTKLHGEGVDFIKVYRNIDKVLLIAVVKEAKKRKLDVAGDLKTISPYRAAQLGITTLEHVANLIDDTFFAEARPKEEVKNGPIADAIGWSRVNLDSPKVERLIDILVENGTAICPTLLVSRRWSLLDEMLNSPKLELMVKIMPYHRYFLSLRNPISKRFGLPYMKKYLPVEQLNKGQRVSVEQGLKNMEKFTKILYESGITLIAGTDSPNPSLLPGLSLHQELKHLEKTGIPREAVLSFATGEAAKVLKRNDLGVIKEGAKADLLLIDGDPLSNLDDLSKISYLVLGGRPISRQELEEMINFQ